MINYLKESKKIYAVLDEELCEEDTKQLQTIISSNGVEIINIDLKNISYIEARTIENILSLKNIADSKHIKLNLLNASESIYDILESSFTGIRFIQDFSTYSEEELLGLLNDPEREDEVINYMVDNYEAHKANIVNNAKQGDAYVRAQCILIIGKAHDISEIETVRAALQSGYPQIVHNALLVLGWFFDSESKHSFYHYLQSENSSIAKAAAASISLIADESDVERLTGMSTSSSPMLRGIVASALALINGDEAYKTVKNMLLVERDEHIIPVLIRQLSFFNNEEAVDIIVSYLDHPSTSIQETAASSLERTGLKNKLDTVVAKIINNDSLVSYFAVKAIGKDCNKDTAELLISIYTKVHENVKLAILGTLGIANVNNTEFFKQCLEDANEDIRKEALASMYSTDSVSGLIAAKERVIKDSSWLVRYKALQILELDGADRHTPLLQEIARTDSSINIREKAYELVGKSL